MGVLVDNEVGDAYIQPIGAPSAMARLRASEAPHWNSESVSMVLGCAGFDGCPAYRRVGPPWFPGCLKSESEEEKRGRQGPCGATFLREEILVGGGFGRDFGGTRYRPHRWQAIFVFGPNAKSLFAKRVAAGLASNATCKFLQEAAARCQKSHFCFLSDSLSGPELPAQPAVSHASA